MNYLQVKKQKRDQKNQNIREELRQKSSHDYDWEELVCSGKVRTLAHNGVNKYLHHHSQDNLVEVEEVRESKVHSTSLPWKSEY